MRGEGGKIEKRLGGKAIHRRFRADSSAYQFQEYTLIPLKTITFKIYKLQEHKTLQPLKHILRLVFGEPFPGNNYFDKIQERGTVPSFQGSLAVLWQEAGGRRALCTGVCRNDAAFHLNLTREIGKIDLGPQAQPLICTTVNGGSLLSMKVMFIN